MMQYADSMPKDAEGLAAIASWRSDPLFRYRFFDNTKAMAYLTRTCRPPMVKAFSQLDDEKRRAELLALVWLRNNGGLYMRHGLTNRGGWDWFLAAAPGGLLTGRLDPLLTTDILYSPVPRSDLIVRSLTILSRKLLGDVSDNPEISALLPKLGPIIAVG